MELGTAIATGTVYLATRIVSFLKKKSMKFVNWKSWWIALVLSVVVVLAINFLAPNLYGSTQQKPRNAANLVVEIIIAWLVSSGIQATKNNITGKDTQATSMVEAVGDVSFNQEFVDHGCTLLIPACDQSGANKDRYVPLEYYVRPGVVQKQFVQDVVAFGSLGNTLAAVGNISDVLYARLRPKTIDMSKPIERVNQPYEFLIDTAAELTLFEFVLLEHSVISALVGADMVRTVFDGRMYFNCFRHGDRWLTTFGFRTYMTNAGDSYINARGVIIGDKNKINIKHGVMVSKEKISEVMQSEWLKWIQEHNMVNGHRIG